MKIDEAERTITGVEIFRAGDYGAKGRYTESDIAKLATLPEGHEPPLTKDHEQTGPAFGWLKRAYAKGEVLMADFADVSADMIKAVKDKAFKKFSVELYKDRPALRAVTILGAQVPHVKGLNPAFAEGAEFVAFDDEGEMEMEEVWPEYMPTSDPFPDAHGTLMEQGKTEHMAGHCHITFLDSNWSGFTSPPVVKDPMTGAWIVTEGHVHQVKGGKVLPASEPVPHTHKFTRPETYAEGDESTQESHMADPKQNETGTAASAVDVAKFAELEAEVAALKAEREAERKANAERVAKLEREAKENKARVDFAEAVKAAEEKAFIAPAAKKAAEALFVFSATSEAVVTFGEGKTGSVGEAVKTLLPFLASVPKGITASGAETFAENGAESREKAIIAKTQEIMGKNPGMQWGDALIFAEQELKG